MLKQRTLRNSIKAVGIGLHTGKNINMELFPSDENTGINFIRTDIDEKLIAAFSIVSPVIEIDFPPPPRSLFHTLATLIGGEVKRVFIPFSISLCILVKTDSSFLSSLFVSLFTNIFHGI